MAAAAELLAVANTHMDTQWRWTVQETILKDLQRTVDLNIALFEKYPDYRFSFEGAWRYMLLKEYFPEQFAALKPWVAKGRWYPAGAFLESTDANIPSPESLIRQALYGNGFFKAEFGKQSSDVILTDSFGFGAALPSAAAHCGLKGFSSYKLSWGAAAPIPFDIGRWVGPDGGSLYAALNPGSFATRLRADLSSDADWTQRVSAIHEKSGIDFGMRYFGAGDHGGAPDDASVDWLSKSIHEPAGPLKIRSATSEDWFLKFTPAEAKQLPSFQGELLMSTHGVGCYTAHAEMKRWNRQNEQLGDQAERAAVLADWLGGAAYPRERLRDSWIRFLWNQMHDIITGTCIRGAYAFSWNDELLAQNQFNAVLKDSIGAISRALDTRGDGIPVVVFNASTRERHEVIATEIEFPGRVPAGVKVKSSSGNLIDAQIAEGREAIKCRVTFPVDVPPTGCTVVHLLPQTEIAKAAEVLDLRVAPHSLENERFSITIGAEGDISKIFDKKLQRNILSGPLRLELRADTSERYPAWELPFQATLFLPMRVVNGPARTRILEQGPSRVSLEVTRELGKSKFVQQIRLSTGRNADQIEIETHVDWREKGYLLKYAFPLAASNPQATYDLGLGTIQRGNNTPKLYEVPAQQWADLSASNGEWGVSIITDCKYGWDKPDDHTLRSSLIHAPTTSKFYKDQSWLDTGRQKMKHVLFVHSGDWKKAGTGQVGEGVNQPLVAFQTSKHSGALGSAFSFLTVNRPEVSVRALKKAEEGDEWVVRVQETSGANTSDVELAFAGKVIAARELDGCERPIGNAKIKNGKLSFDLDAYRPRTFALKLNAPKAKLAPVRSYSVELACDTNGTSTLGKKDEHPFAPDGAAIPSELFPKELFVGGAAFELGEPGKANVARCTGQKVSFPKAPEARRLYFLAASAKEGETADFTVAGVKHHLSIPYLGAKIGQNDLQPVTNEGQISGPFRPGYLIPEEVAWTATHRYDSSGSLEPYLFCHLFKYSVPVPPGANAIELPNNPAVGVFAMCLGPDVTPDFSRVTDSGENMIFWTDSPPQPDHLPQFESPKGASADSAH